MKARIEIPGGGAKPRRPYFARKIGSQFEGRSAGDVAEIEIYDEIGAFGVTAKDFRSQLREVTESTIRLRLNSPGGDVFDAIAIHNDLLEANARVEVEISGIAASAASVIAMAGDRISIAENAFLMIHNAWVLAAGNRNHLTDLVETLEAIDAALAGTYAKRSGLAKQDIREMMDAETWFDGNEAVKQGFADETLEPAPIQAAFDLSGFRHPPRRAPSLALLADNDEPERADVERALRLSGGFSRAEAAAHARALVGAAGPEFVEAAERLCEAIRARAVN